MNCERERVSLHRMVFSTKCFSFCFSSFLFLFIHFFFFVFGSNHMLIHTVAYISFGYLKGCTQPIKRSIFGVCEYVMLYSYSHFTEVEYFSLSRAWNRWFSLNRMHFITERETGMKLCSLRFTSRTLTKSIK